MLVKVKLYAILRRYAPVETKPGQPFIVELPEASTVADLIKHLNLPPHEVKVAFVNGRAQPETFALPEAADVGIFPPVGGG